MQFDIEFPMKDTFYCLFMGKIRQVVLNHFDSEVRIGALCMGSYFAWDVKYLYFYNKLNKNKHDFA